MALNKSRLESAILEATRSPTADVGITAKRLAKAYATYAKDAQSCQGVNPTVAQIDVAQLVLATTFEAAFRSGSNPAVTIQTMATGLSAFWLLPPVTFIGVTPGLVTVALPATAAGFLLSTINGGNSDAKQAARKLANALDSFSKTVLVVHAPPSVCSSPLT